MQNSLKIKSRISSLYIFPLIFPIELIAFLKYSLAISIFQIKIKK